MRVKELTDLTVRDLLREYKRSFTDYWGMYDEAVKEFKRKWRIKTLKEFAQKS